MEPRGGPAGTAPHAEGQGGRVSPPTPAVLSRSHGAGRPPPWPLPEPSALPDTTGHGVAMSPSLTEGNALDCGVWTFCPATSLNSLIESNSLSVGLRTTRTWVSSAKETTPVHPWVPGPGGARLPAGLSEVRGGTAGPGLHKPDVVGLGLSPGWWPTCPVQGEACPLPRGHVPCVRYQEQLRVPAAGSERVHQGVT